jgi:hypothetical protein
MFLLKHKDIIKEEETETNSGLISWLAAFFLFN